MWFVDLLLVNFRVLSLLWLLWDTWGKNLLGGGGIPLSLALLGGLSLEKQLGHRTKSVCFVEI